MSVRRAASDGEREQAFAELEAAKTFARARMVALGDVEWQKFCDL